MGVNYIEAKGKEVLKNCENTACYSKIFGHGVEDKTDTIILYQKNLLLADEYAAKWARTLNRFKFYCKYKGKGDERYNLGKEYHIFEIDVTKYKWNNHLCSTLTMLRYLFEAGYSYESMITTYYDIRKKHPKIRAFNALQMAFTVYCGNNHSCHSNRGATCFHSYRELFAKFARKRSTVHGGGTDLHGCWKGNKPTVGFRQGLTYKQLYNILNNKPIMRKIFVVGGNTGYANWLPDTKVVKTLDEADVVMFTGGEDVDPSLYNQPKHPATYSDLDRDNYEKDIYKQAKAKDLPTIGICRGSQFLCVMAGGQLVQHQQNPHPEHIIHTTCGDINITSTHHQAAYPYNMPYYKYKVLGWTVGISPIHEDGHQQPLCLKDSKECEIVYYRDANSLGIQGHPEFAQYQRDPANQKSLEVLKQYYNDFLNNKL